MKKIWKVFIGLAAAAAVLLTGGVMASTANAKETANTGSITIQPAVANQEYKAYKIFDIASYSTDGKKVVYKLADDSPWKDFFTNGDGMQYVTIDNGIVDWKDAALNDSTTESFSKAAIAYANANSISADGSNSASSPRRFARSIDATTSTDEESATISGLPLGYYLVTSSVGSLVSLDSTLSTDGSGKLAITIKDKNDVPTVVKEVQENPTEKWGNENDAQIGDTVNFKTTITAKKGAANYVLHDSMSAGLTLNADSIQVTNGKTSAKLSRGIDYTVTSPVTHDSVTDTFDVTFTETLLNTLENDDTLIVEYTATVNENAVIAGEGNPNTTKLQYGDTSKSNYTPESQTTTYVWDFNVFKFAQENGKEIPLADATFKLTKEANGTAINFVKSGNNYRVAKSDENDKVAEFTTDGTGTFNLSGLDSGTYYLYETHAPDGYNQLTEPTTVIIDFKGNVKTSDAGTALVDKTVKVENKAGSRLPQTGGIGTTILYLAGAVIVVVAVLGLVTVLRKRPAAR